MAARRSTAREPFTLSIQIEGMRGTLAGFRNLPADASDRLRDAATSLAAGMAMEIAQAGRAKGGQAALVAQTVKARRDRVPFVLIGSSARVGRAWPGRGKAKASELLFGSEFGALRTPSRKYSPFGYETHTGKKGRWIFPTVEKNQGDIAAAWLQAADEIVREFTSVPDAD